MDNPSVVIIIPTKDRAKYLPRSIESALNQTYQNVRVLVVDDGSTDNTLEVVSKYQDNPKFGYIQLLPPASGTAATGRNLGLAVTKSDYVSFLDSDDEIVPHKIELQLQKMQEGEEKLEGYASRDLPSISPYPRHKGIDVCYAMTKIIRPNGDIKILGESMGIFDGFFPYLTQLNKIDDMGALMVTGLYKKDIFHQLGTFRSQRFGEDTEIKDRILFYGANILFESTIVYIYYTGTEESLMKLLKENPEDQVARQNEEENYINYKREMKKSMDNSDFVSKFKVKPDFSSLRIGKRFSNYGFEIDELIEVTQESIENLRSIA